MVFAGCALTFFSSPNIILTPAFLAGFTRVLMRQRPGSVNTPFFLTSVVAMATKLLIILEHVDCFISCFAARAFVKAPLLMALAPAFMDLDFMGGNMFSSRKPKAPRNYLRCK